jgi:hypothetical protein
VLARMLARAGYVHRRALKAPAVRQAAAVALQQCARDVGLRLSMVEALDLSAQAVETAGGEAQARVLDGRL